MKINKYMKINGVNGKSENIAIIMVIAPKITGEFFSKTNITCEILLRSDPLKKKGGTKLMSEDIQVFVNRND